MAPTHMTKILLFIEIRVTSTLLRCRKTSEMHSSKEARWEQQEMDSYEAQDGLLLQPKTAYALLQDPEHTRRLSFGCPVLDGTFGGGIPAEGINEVAGMAGSGKTQIMLQLLIQQHRPVAEGGLGGGRAFFLSTEGAFPARRFQEMLAAQEILERVIIMEAKNVDDQRAILMDKLPGHLQDRELDIRLVLVDSISALFRAEFGANMEDSVDRSRIIFGMAKQMKLLNHLYRVPFVITNQVTADFGATGNAVQPALGLTWSSCVNTRFLVTRRDGMSHRMRAFAAQLEASGGQGGPTSIFTRELRLLFSPLAPPDMACEFIVCPPGVRGVPCHPE